MKQRLSFNIRPHPEWQNWSLPFTEAALQIKPHLAEASIRDNDKNSTDFLEIDVISKHYAITKGIICKLL